MSYLLNFLNDTQSEKLCFAQFSTRMAAWLLPVLIKLPVRVSGRVRVRLGIGLGLGSGGFFSGGIFS